MATEGRNTRTAGEAGWHASRYNLAAPVPGTKNVALANLFKGNCAEYTPLEMYLLSVVEELDEGHPIIERFAKRGVIANFDERAKTPRVAVKVGSRALAEGVDYTLSYAKGRKNVGRYAVTVKCKGNYEFAAQTLAFKINPKGTKLKKVAAGPRKVTVKWAKQLAKMSSSKVTGYRIQLSTSPTFKKGNKLITVKGAAKTSKAIGKLKAKKRYYARVQTYKKAGGKTYYSA